MNNIAQLESIAECECEKHRIAAIFVVEDTGLETECHSAKVFHRKGCFTCMVGLMQRTVGIGCYLKDTRESTSWELYSVYLEVAGCAACSLRSCLNNNVTCRSGGYVAACAGSRIPARREVRWIIDGEVSLRRKWNTWLKVKGKRTTLAGCCRSIISY